MTSVEVKSPAGKAGGSVELPAHVFDVPANIPLMHQVVTAQLAAARQGTHSTKTRGEVRGGGRKPYRQKGTGRARQGSTRAPQFTGGGISHGPKPRDYSQRTPKKMKAAALRGALSDRARAGLVHVVSAFVDGDAPSTKAARTALSTIAGGEPRRALVVLERGDEVSWLSLRNLPNVHVLVQDQLNTYDVLVNDLVVFTRPRWTRSWRGRSRCPPGPRGRGPRPPPSEPVALAKAPAASTEAPVRHQGEQRPPRRRRSGRAATSRWRTARSPTASRSRATPTRCSTTCRTARSTSAPRPRSGSPTPEAAEQAGFQLPKSQRDDDEEADK